MLEHYLIRLATVDRFRAMWLRAAELWSLGTLER